MLIRDWDEWQSYRKDRSSPPWIKVHRNIFSSRKWAVLSDAEKGQLVSLWILAADNNGSIPDDLKILKKIAQLDDLPNIKKFKELGLIVSGERHDGVNFTSDKSQGDAPEQIRDRAETETEERRGETDLRPLDDRFFEFWEKYPSRRKVKKADAQKKWKSEKLDHIADEILQGLESWKASEDWAKDNGEYICAPIVFLNQKRWLDEPQKAGLLVEKPKFESTNARFLRQLKEADDALNAEQKTYDHDEILKIGGKNGR
jgi:hypothetical protein